MYTCDDCGKEFKSLAALGGHRGKKHPREGERQPWTRHNACPVCRLELCWSPVDEFYRRTVCPRCLAHYDLVDGKLLSPPPEQCVVESAGLPCTQPLHKYYYEVYTKEKVIV